MALLAAYRGAGMCSFIMSGSMRDDMENRDSRSPFLYHKASSNDSI